jgi:hypothetical protein
MTLREIIVRYGRKTPTAYAALCTARAGALLGRYPAGEHHSILAMIRCDESEVETAVTALVQSHGWRNVVIEEWKLLEMPFFSTDRQVRACYVSAMTSDGGLVVYTDTLDERLGFDSEESTA